MYEIVQDRRGAPVDVHTVQYSYDVDDETGRSVFGYHWHPAISNRPYPHLHIGHATVDLDILHEAGRSDNANGLRAEIADVHFPTGRISLESVLRMLVTDLGVDPLQEHASDWQAILAETEHAFQARQSWHH
ncbi:MAG: hypothetical protein GEU28_13625 [Dehalococcoidia bacterium]|nr:hypothetical protein [Dehalococcoidia bacterium]